MIVVSLYRYGMQSEVFIELATMKIFVGRIISSFSLFRSSAIWRLFFVSHQCVTFCWIYCWSLLWTCWLEQGQSLHWPSCSLDYILYHCTSTTSCSIVWKWRCQKGGKENLPNWNRSKTEIKILLCWGFRKIFVESFRWQMVFNR